MYNRLSLPIFLMKKIIISCFPILIFRSVQLLRIQLTELHRRKTSKISACCELLQQFGRQNWELEMSTIMPLQIMEASFNQLPHLSIQTIYRFSNKTTGLSSTNSKSSSQPHSKVKRSNIISPSFSNSKSKLSCPTAYRD